MIKDDYMPVAINSKIETEDVLGPLPTNWEKAQWGRGRKLFVDHSSNITSWIDPRTNSLRKHDILEVVEGELPYGWEEAFDDVCGIYYMDHVNRLNFLDGPWTAGVQKVILEKRLAQEQEARVIQQQLEEDKRKKEEMGLAEDKMRKLEAARLKLERDLQKLHSGAGGEDADMDEEEERLRAELLAIEQHIDQEQVEFEEVAAEQEEVNQEILDFQNRLKEIQMANERMEGDNNQLIVENVKATKDLDEIRNMIEAEAAQRAALESYIKSLKLEVIEMYDPDKAEQMRGVADGDSEEEQEQPLPIHGSMNAEVELLELKARLEAEKEERLRLKELTETLEAERNRIQEEMLNDDEEAEHSNLPEWILELNVNAKKSKTLRNNIMLANPDKLEFREKVLKFTAAAIESNEQPKLPSQPHNATNEFAVKAKETAFGGGGGERLAIPEESSNLQRINSESIDLIHNLEQEIHHSTHDLVVAEEVGDDD